MPEPKVSRSFKNTLNPGQGHPTSFSKYSIKSLRGYVNERMCKKSKKWFYFSTTRYWMRINYLDYMSRAQWNDSLVQYLSLLHYTTCCLCLSFLVLSLEFLLCYSNRNFEQLYFLFWFMCELLSAVFVCVRKRCID